MKRARLAWRPRCGGAPAGGVRTGHEYRYFMMELPVIGMLKCPVNINFAKVIVFIDGFLLTVFVLAQSCLKAKAGKTAKQQRPFSQSQVFSFRGARRADRLAGVSRSLKPPYILWILHGY